MCREHCSGQMGGPEIATSVPASGSVGTSCGFGGLALSGRHPLGPASRVSPPAR